jgi:hypothetical protein
VRTAGTPSLRTSLRRSSSTRTLWHGTFGASETYTATFWGPTVGTRRLFFQHARRCLNDDVRHAWALHNERIVNKPFKYVCKVLARSATLVMLRLSACWRGIRTVAAAAAIIATTSADDSLRCGYSASCRYYFEQLPAIKFLSVLFRAAASDQRLPSRRGGGRA